MHTPLGKIINGLESYTTINKKRVSKAYFLAEKFHKNQKRKSGEPYFSHPIAVAEYLINLNADEDTIIAALLHDAVEDTPLNIQTVKVQFGKEVALLVDGVTKISTNQLRSNKSDRHFHSLKKLFAVMGQDIRCIIIKLCDRLHNMKTLAFLPREKQIRIAEETLQIFVPLTKKLNLEKLRHQLSTECYRILYPEIFTTYLKTQATNAEKADRALFHLRNLLDEGFSGNFDIRIFPQIHFISPDEKKEDLEYLEIGDTHMIQIITSDVSACYQILFLLHKLYTAQPNTFKDYITNPKDNGYQALHTKIIDPHGNILTIQIVTKEMAKIAWKGITVYWKGRKNAFTFDNIRNLPIRIQWLEDLVEFSQESERKLDEMNEYLEKDFLKKRIFVIDEFGKMFDVPENSTVLDFLYAHSPDQAGFVTEILVNKEVASLDTQLQNGDKIEFDFDEKIKTNVEWLSFVRTYSARKHIQSDLSRSPLSQQIRIGEKLLQQEFDAQNKGIITAYPQKKWKKVAEDLGLSVLEDILSQIGSGKIQARDVFEAFFDITQKKKQTASRYKFFFGKNDEKKAQAAVSFLAKSERFFLRKTEIKLKKNYAAIIAEGIKQKELTEPELFRHFSKIEGVQKIRAIMPQYKKFFIGMLLGSAFILLLIFFLLLNAFQQYQAESRGVFHKIFLYAPFAIIIGANIISLKTMRNYWRLIRSNKAYISASLLMNTLAVILIFFLMRYAGININIAAILGILLIGVLFDSYQYVDSSLETHEEEVKSISQSQWNTYKKEKYYGYFLRIAAVIIFGANPIVVRYYLSDLDGLFVSAFSFFLAALFLLVLIGVKLLFSQKKSSKKEIISSSPYSPSFFLAVIFDGLMVMVYFLSVRYTVASNAALFLNFAPVVALIISLLFLRTKSSFFHNKKSTTNIILLFLIGCLGSSLLIINKVPENIIAPSEKIIGDIIGIFIVIFDVIGTMATIHYAKQKYSFSGIDFIFRKVLILAILFSPFVLMEITDLTLSVSQLAAFVYTGIVYALIGYWCAYEAFKRVDGLIGYLLVNLAPVVTISLEIFVFDLPLSFLFIIGAFLILAASIGAEYVNNKQEKKQLQSVTPVSNIPL